MAASQKIGLALSGGGALGSYQVGQIKAYAEIFGRVDVLAGASVGALNGAVLACAPSLERGVESLERIWLEGRALRLILALAQNIGLAERILRWLSSAVPEFDASAVPLGELDALVDEHIDFRRLAQGPPFYVSVYESDGTFIDITKYLLARVGISDTRPSRFIRVQDYAPHRQREFILASAALPMVFAPRGGLADGGLGGAMTNQGNTPVDPLVEEGCDPVVISHPTDGSLWSRDNYPSTTVIELRPRKTISRGFLRDLFESDRGQLEEWMQQGYEDAREDLADVADAVRIRHERKRSVARLGEDEAAADRALARLRKARLDRSRRE